MQLLIGLLKKYFFNFKIFLIPPDLNFETIEIYFDLAHIKN